MRVLVLRLQIKGQIACAKRSPPQKKDRSNIGNNTNVVCRGASSGPGAFLASSAPPSRCLFISLSFSDSLGETGPDLPESPNNRLATQMVALLTQNCQPFAQIGPRWSAMLWGARDATACAVHTKHLRGRFHRLQSRICRPPGSVQVWMICADDVPCQNCSCTQYAQVFCHQSLPAGKIRKESFSFSLSPSISLLWNLVTNSRVERLVVDHSLSQLSTSVQSSSSSRWSFNPWQDHLQSSRLKLGLPFPLPSSKPVEKTWQSRDFIEATGTLDAKICPAAGPDRLVLAIFALARTGLAHGSSCAKRTRASLLWLKRLKLLQIPSVSVCKSHSIWQRSLLWWTHQHTTSGFVGGCLKNRHSLIHGLITCSLFGIDICE